MSKYFIMVRGKFKEVDCPIENRTKIQDAVTIYVKTCTAIKCKKNQNSEKLHFYKFEAFLAAKSIFYMNEISSVVMQEYEAYLLNQMKVSSCNRRFNTLKHFFNRCQQWRFISENPCFGMKKRKEEVNPHLVWPEHVFLQFLRRTSGVYTHLFEFLYLTGARPAEAKNLRWTDINHDQTELILKCGKNAHVSRVFPMDTKLSRLFHRIKIDSLHVFSVERKQISNDLLYHYCKTRLRDLGESKYTVYGLRHTFATRMAARGGNAFQVAELMGHSKIETTRRYIKTNRNDLVKLLARRASKK